MQDDDQQLLTLGWREWVQLPELGLRNIKAKVDTGARTSALHAFAVEPFDDNGISSVRFKIHPNQRDSDTIVVCSAVLIDERMVTDSGGHKEKRWVIETPINIGKHVWSAEFTLTARDDMLFRMLLGRTAIKNRAVVDPSRSYLIGKRRKKKRHA